MTLNNTASLAVFEIVIYIPILFIAHYLLFRHGRHGIMAWLAFSSFCALRIIAGILEVVDWHKEQKGESVGNAASIVNSVGLSALLVACIGVVHEASSYEYNHRRVLGWIIAIHMHVAVAVGIILGIVGGINLYSAKTESDAQTDQHLLEAGALITLVTVLAILTWSGIMIHSLSRTAQLESSRAVHSATVLCYGVMVALVVLLARVIYSIVFAFTLRPELSPYFGAFWVKLVFITLIQLFAALVLLGVGLKTNNIKFEAAVTMQQAGYGGQGVVRDGREMKFENSERPSSGV